MGLVVYVRVDSSEVLDDIRNLNAKAASFREPLARLAEHTRRSFRENFIRAGRPERWQPIKTGTIIGRLMQTRFSRLTTAIRDRNRSPLVDEGILMQSYTTKGGNHVEQVGHNSLVVGSADPLASIHEYGTGVHGSKGRPYEIRPRRGKALRFMSPTGPVYARKVSNPGVPARPVAIIQPEDADHAVDLIVEHLRGDS